ERPCRGQRGVRSDLDEPVQAEEPGVELVPTRVRLLREADPLRLGIDDAEDPRTAVARAAVVAGLEPLVDDDVRAAARELPRRGRAQEPRADDRNPRHAA